MSSCQKVAIREFALLHYGQGLKSVDRMGTGPFPVFGSSGQVGYHDTAIVDYPTLIIGRKGSVGQVTYAPSGGWPIDTVFYTEFLKPGQVDLRYFYYALKSSRLERLTITTSIPGINRDDLYSIKIPLLPPSQQRRIAAILDKADAIRRKRQEALALTDEFLRSAFLDMFGDPVTNPKGWKDVPLHKAARFVSGGTPSKENKKYWEGEFPWVSPKDMKTIEILDSADHVHETVFEETSLSKIPENAILIVVRGMILAHTVPLAIARRPITINQDMKALLFKDEIIPEFALWAIRVQHDHLLTKVSTAAHGTKRFDMQDLEAICIPVPEPQLQRTFQSISRKFLSITDQYKTSTQSFNNLFHSLTQRAFRGEL